jgi:hypothetical protein
MSLAIPDSPPDMTLTRAFSVSSRALIENLSDPEKIPLRHPLIHRIQIISRAQEGALSKVLFDVWEKVPLLWFSVPNHYTGMIVCDPSHPNEILTEAWSKPLVHLRMHLSANASGDQCILTEKAWIEAPWPLRSFVIRTFTRAHQEQFDRLAGSLQQEPR